MELSSAAQTGLCRTKPSLRFERVSKSYGRAGVRNRAVDAVSFSLGYGEIVALLGPNGAGKTTIIKLLGGLVAPDGGVIGLEPAGSHRSERLAPHLGIVLDGGRDLIDDLTPIENLQYFGALMGCSRQESMAVGGGLLDRFGLGPERRMPVKRLSRGKRQALSLCTALIHGPKFLVLDEPTLGLDAAVLHALSQLLRELRDEGLGVLIATHSIEFVEPLADRTLMVGGGKIIAEVANRARHGDAAEQHFEIRLARLPSLQDLQTLGAQPSVATDNVISLRCRAADLADRLRVFGPFGVRSLEVAASGLAATYLAKFGAQAELAL